jgi:hypothetical protein
MGLEAVDTSGSDEEEGVQAGDESIWDQGTMTRVQDFAKLVDEVGTAREALNAKLAAGKTGLIDDGFNKDALDAAIKYAKTPEEKRENWDLSYMYARKALNVPIQDDLFTHAMSQQVKVTKSKPTDEE